MTASTLQVVASFSTPIILALVLAGLVAIVWRVYLRDDTHDHAD